MLSRQQFFVFLRTNQDISKAMGWPKLGLWIFGRIFCACHSRAISSFDLRMKNVNQSKKTCSAIPKPLNSLNYRLFNRFLFLRDDAVRREIYPEILSARSIPIHPFTHTPLEGSKETHFSFKQLSSTHAAARGEKSWRIHIRNVEKLSAELEGEEEARKDLESIRTVVALGRVMSSMIAREWRGERAASLRWQFPSFLFFKITKIFHRHARN